MYVIGTAGHVDHGKSSLVKALTGVNPDRLKEEIEREMTIDLGFAWLTLPNGEQVGIVDMPGHRDFIENMLAGIGGIDAVLFVVAADEGVMPQTKEHLAIINLLQIKQGLIVLTKTDLVNDPEWLKLVQQDIRKTVQGTALAQAPILPVSSVTGAGLDALKQAIIELISMGNFRTDVQKPRLPIDRVFSITGFGTVVTGTLIDGSLEIGQEIVILPGGVKGRIRGLQSYKTKQKIIEPGNRAAVNITGISPDQIWRGEVLCLPDTYSTTRVFHAHIQLLFDANLSLLHNSQIKLYIGSAEYLVKVRLLGRNELSPGEEGWARIESTNEMVVTKRDRFILRRPSPAETIGGGEVVEDHPARKIKRSSQDLIQHLEILKTGDSGEVLLQKLQQMGTLSIEDALGSIQVTRENARQVIDQLISEEKVLLLNRESNADDHGMLFDSISWNRISSAIQKEINAFHQKNPLKKGMLKEELKSKLKMDSKPFQVIITKMTNDGYLKENAIHLSIPSHRIVFEPNQQKQVETLLSQFSKNALQPPSVKECIEEVGAEVFQALLDTNQLIQISEDVVYRSVDLESLHKIVLKHFKSHPTLTVGEFRDEAGISRKYALAILEYLDKRGITLREEDARIFLKDKPLTD